MKHCKVPETRTTRRIVPIVCVTALIVVLGGALPQATRDDRLRPPVVPANLHVPANNKVFLKGEAVGTQNYICLPSGSAFAWILFGPQATLFDDRAEQVITHFLSANPDESGTLRAAWQDSKDTSAVWAMAIANSSDPMFVAPGAIPWLLLQWVGSERGLQGGRRLTPTTYIQRVNTGGGIAPSTGCALSSDVGKKAFVPYTADYFFYRKSGSRSNDVN